MTAPIDRHLNEVFVNGESILDGNFLKARRDRVTLPDGAIASREYIVHPGAVCMIPRRDDGAYVMVRQFRYPLHRVFLEFPAGKIDPGEAPLATGKRELVEEVGYTAQRWTRLGDIHPVISYSTEVIHMWLAEGLAHVGNQLDAGEFLEVVTLTHAELLAAFDRGEITDSKTVAGLFWMERRMAARALAAQLTIRGRVQGVGYRDALTATAMAAGLAGWVRNRADGSVEAHLQGSPAALERVVAWAARGPIMARVQAVERSDAAVDSAHTTFALRDTD